MSLSAFFVAAIVILSTPGPTNTILAASGAALGWRGAWTLPLAEAAGYLVAVSAYLMLAERVAGIPAAMATLKAVAACWLLYSAWRLWSRPVESSPTERTSAFIRVFATTLLNPKAMLVGAVLIPAMADKIQATAIVVHAALSLVAGAGWTIGGSLTPNRFRPHSYKVAAVVVAMFSVMAASSAVAG